MPYQIRAITLADIPHIVHHREQMFRDMGIPAEFEAMARETRALEVVLDQLGAAAGTRPGVFFLASTAGGLYSGSRQIPITEETPVEPISDYGRAKLRQEEMLASWASSRPTDTVPSTGRRVRLASAVALPMTGLS